MDTDDHSKIQASGHEAVNICHKCGWPFPNPHPSARHRRAHKRICGTVEGYKLVDSEGNNNLNASDDEHLSDEDHKTPSPRVLERSINEKGSGVIRGRSSRSEDEVFSDCAAEFSDSGFSPGVEEGFVDARKSATNMERVAKDDFSSNQSVKDGAIADTIQPPSSSADSYQMKNHEVPDSTTDLLESTLQCQNDIPTDGSLLKSIPGHIAQEPVVVLSNDSNNPSPDSYPMKSETSADDAPHESKTKAGETLTESSLEVIGEGNSSKGIQEVKLDGVSQDIVIKHSTAEMIGIASKLEETDEQDALSADGVFQLKEGHSKGLNSKICTGDFHAEMESAQHADSSFDTAQINVGAAQATGFTSSSSIVEVSDGKEVNESVHVLSLPEDVRLVDHPEVMVEGFRDHKEVKLHQLVPLDSCERIRDKEDGRKDAVCEEKSSSFQLGQLSDGAEATFSAMPVLEVKPDDSSCKPAVKEVLFEGDVSLPEVMVAVDKNNQSDEVGVPAGAATVEIKKSHQPDEGGVPADDVTFEIKKSHAVCFTEEERLHDTFKENVPDVATGVLSDAIIMGSSSDAKVSEATNLVGTEEAGNHEKGRNENYDRTGTENYEGFIEKNSTANSAKTHESSSNISGFQINSVISSSDSIYAGDQELCKTEKHDTSENHNSLGPMEENVSMKTKSVPEFASDFHDSQVVAENVMTDGSKDEVPETGFTHLDTVSDSSRIGIVVSDIQEGTEDKINGSKTVQVECVHGVDVPTELHHAKDTEILQKASDCSEYHVTEESLVSPLNESSIKISAAVEENDMRESGGGASRIASETLQAEGNNNIVNQHLIAPAADISMDSCSRTDSLEAHWGSVSVLSTQSDVPTIIDAESLPSTDSIAPAGAAHNAGLKKLNVESEGQLSDRSDIFEPPSFLTLVEPGGANGQKVDGSEIQAAQNLQQPTSASLQAGWFPSLTHVVNESQGRKKNEELIAKVTNWSSGGTGKQHVPLKSLISEASLETKPKSPSPKENPMPVFPKDDTAAKGNKAQTTTVNSILGTESPSVQATKIEAGKEWNSPARYPSDIKREKRKVKGRPYWAQFMCCSSVN